MRRLGRATRGGCGARVDLARPKDAPLVPARELVDGGRGRDARMPGDDPELVTRTRMSWQDWILMRSARRRAGGERLEVRPYARAGALPPSTSTGIRKLTLVPSPTSLASSISPSSRIRRSRTRARPRPEPRYLVEARSSTW